VVSLVMSVWLNIRDRKRKQRSYSH
jgi:hypothetical protein